MHDPTFPQTSFHVITNHSESVSVGGGYLAEKRVEVKASLSSELSGASWGHMHRRRRAEPKRTGPVVKWLRPNCHSK